MNFDLNDVDSLFPLKKYRSGQKAAIEKILTAFKNGKRFVFLEAPTGAGKSAIAFTIAQFSNSAYYLTTQKFLQDQLTKDFGENGLHIASRSPMIDLKGRNAYQCNYYARKLTENNLTKEERQRFTEHCGKNPHCDIGQCKRDGKSKLDYCNDKDAQEWICPYFKRVDEALASRICLMNFSSFLFQSSVVQRFPPRELLIIDECHNTEDALLKFVEINLSDKRIPGIKFPEFETAAEYLNFFIENDFKTKIENLAYIAQITMNSREEDEWRHILLKLEMLEQSDVDNWICTWEEKEGSHRNVVLKPIFVDEFVQKYIFSGGKMVLMMSATILSKPIFARTLGIKDEEVASFTMPSVFHKDSRPIYYRPAGSMSFKNKSETLPKLVKSIEDICDFHENDKGIIHTHTFDIAYAIINGCRQEIRDRFIFQKSSEFNNNKYAMINKQKESNNSIILAPAMHEGLDLSDDLGRFQVICKVPYPSKGDPQIAKRIEDSPAYYDWRAMTKLIQSAGRICRHDADHGVTYVVDSDFKWFVERNKKIVPGWFAEAIIWD
jgi:Rad3-related DNA helicase